MSTEFSGRRLPVYLVLDCSGSMTGEPIEAVRQGVKALLADLRNDPQALETAYLSILTFDSDARQTSPLLEISAFEEPNLQASGSTALGAALKLVRERIGTEVRKSTPTQKGDWKPLVFIMSDGGPTDSWEEAAAALKATRANIICLAAGPGADEGVLRRISEVVIRMTDLQPDTLKACFKWVSASVKAVSASCGATGSPVNAPALPPGIVIVP